MLGAVRDQILSSIGRTRFVPIRRHERLLGATLRTVLRDDNLAGHGGADVIT